MAEPTWEQSAAWKVALLVLIIFGAVYLLCFVIGLVGLSKEGSNFDASMELIKFMLTTIMPLVTLAVGYYLGSRTVGGAD